METEFADEEALLKLLPYFCAGEPDPRRGDRHDPITGTVVTLLTSPLQLALTEVGALPFYGASTLLYPYNLMTERQKGYVRACLERRDEWNVYSDAVVFRRPKSPAQLAPAPVLRALCRKLFEGRGPADPARRTGLCNIILQRVQGYVRIDKPVQRALNEWLAARLEPAAQPPAATQATDTPMPEAPSVPAEPAAAAEPEGGPAAAAEPEEGPAATEPEPESAGDCVYNADPPAPGPECPTN